MPRIKNLLWVGTKGFNYEYNLKFSTYLDELGIAHRKLEVGNATHSAKMIYEKRGIELMRFHRAAFEENRTSAAPRDRYVPL